MGGIGVNGRPIKKLVALSKSERPISDMGLVWGYKIAFMFSNSILDPSGAIMVNGVEGSHWCSCHGILDLFRGRVGITRFL